MRYVSLLTVILLGCLFLTSCAALQQAWVQQNCNTDAAYSNGTNAARHGKDMQINYAASCPVDQAKINAAYRKGYQFMLKHQPPEINIKVSGKKFGKNYSCHEQYGKTVCGYDCVNTAGQWTCKQNPD